MSIDVDATLPVRRGGDSRVSGGTETAKQGDEARFVLPGQRREPWLAELRQDSGSVALTAEGASVEVSVETATKERPPVEAPDHAFRQWLRRWGLHLELALALGVGLGVVSTAGSPGVVLATLGTWVVGAFYRGRAVTTPLQGQLRAVASSALLPLALLSVSVAVLSVPSTAVREAVLAVVGAAAVTTLSRSLRWTMQAPVRVIAVGDRAAVATAITQLPRTSRCRVVGGIVAEEGLEPADVPREILGVTTYGDLRQVAEVTERHEADLVMVDPGRAVSPDDFRAMTWDLDRTRVAVGVSGVVRSIGPHRLTAGKLGRAAVLDVRLPRQSRYVRGVKSLIDRVVGLIALVLVSPVLLGLAVAIRMDSPGAAIFRQTRVGRDGRPFVVYKLRTMVVDAEERKDELVTDNDEDKVLFKLQEDPRVTRLGSFLRTSSLDELPQLLNVVRGEMSLVGPRPHLPDEVDRMDERTLRRHAVAPGMTGLWQVSGRSDLSRAEATELDTYYADNWNLSGDASILARTVKAVMGRKGAY